MIAVGTLAVFGCTFPTQFVSGTAPLGEPLSQVQPVAQLLPGPQKTVIAPLGPTQTPFQPEPITGTPPPSSTPVPTPVPSPTPSPTPWKQPAFAPPSVPVYGIPGAFPVMSPEHHINFLLLGSDSRGGVSFRTDTIIIVSIDPTAKIVTLISLPRDLWVFIPGWTMNRINTAYLHGELDGYPGGGMALIKDTVLYNLGLRIDHVALVDFEGFRKIVDQVGGIDVPLVCPFTEWTVKNPNISIQLESNWKLITIGPGVVHMDGAMALWYARARMRSNDFDRGRRQQEVIRALYTTALNQNLLLQAPRLYTDFSENVDTDVSLQTIISLVPIGLNVGEAQIRSYYVGDDLTWGWTTPSGASVLLPNREAIFNMLLEATSPEIQAFEGPRVEIWNRTTNEGWETLAAERLHYAGFETVYAEPSGDTVEKTSLFDLQIDADLDAGLEILEVLGLKESSLRNDPQENREAEFRLVIGEDYDPCFDPTRP
jgi:LCP family protein required for cell wall assembly